MRWRRERRKPGSVTFRTEEGKALPLWALRAGARIIATDYDAEKRALACVVELPQGPKYGLNLYLEDAASGAST